GKKGNKMFAVGHLASGYILGKLTAHSTRTRMNLPLIFTLSIIPDIDILIRFLQHRGPSHSILIAIIIFTPIFVVLRKNAVPYFIALVQHSLVGDFIVGGGTQLLWPFTSQYYGLEIGIKNPVNIFFEWATFLMMTMVLLKTQDIQMFLQPHNLNLLLSIPTLTVLLPTLVAFPLDVPPTLLFPHIMFLILFSASLIIDLKHIFSNAVNK
ncbi:MAG: metal-dependent hydrolase, partial [Candidatus Bathyarchaeia archaeon]